jgi:two-component system, sensor histidine kinase
MALEDRQQAIGWDRLPGMVALLSRTGIPLAFTRGWAAHWASTAHAGDWREALDTDSRCRLLDALAQDRDFDVPMDVLGNARKRGHWRCIGWWSESDQAHGCQFVDVTPSEDQRRAATAMCERIHLLFDQLPMQVAYFGPPPVSICLFANDSFARHQGLQQRTIIGLPLREILSPDDRQRVRQLQPSYLADGGRLLYKHSMRDPQGEIRHFRESWIADRDAQGRECGTFVLLADVTEQHRAETSLRASEERLARFMEVSAEGVIFHRDGVITDVNPAACRLLSLPYHELVGRSMLSLPPQARQSHSAMSMDSGADAAIETEVLDGRGQLIPVELVGRSLLRRDQRQRMTVIRDTRDRRAAQERIHALIEDLRAQKDRAEAADRAKSVFLAAASHDLRQPIHAMGLFLSALRTMARAPSAVNPEELADICRRMQSSLDGLGQLLNMLLDVSRLDANAVQVQIGPCALNPLFQELEQEFIEVASEKGLQLHVQHCSAWVSADATVLRRILSNLMANALRYTPRGRVVLGARRRGSLMEIQVCDSGIGIVPEQLETIFEEFYQIGQTRARRDESHGLGLGLSIVKRSARLIGAELHVRSTPARGSIFSVSLPRCEAPPPSAPAEPEPVASSASAGQRSVLVIDDDEQVLAGMQQLLQIWGHRVWCAASADAAVVLAIEHAAEIDLLLSDYRLGGNTTAVQAIAAVHACLGRAVPTFILTGDTSPQRIQEASELGFPLLHKPVDTNALIKALAEQPA